jgi:hypothetical protein
MGGTFPRAARRTKARGCANSWTPERTSRPFPLRRRGGRDRVAGQLTAGRGTTCSTLTNDDARSGRAISSCRVSRRAERFIEDGSVSARLGVFYGKTPERTRKWPLAGARTCGCGPAARPLPPTATSRDSPEGVCAPQHIPTRWCWNFPLRVRGGPLTKNVPNLAIQHISPAGLRGKLTLERGPDGDSACGAKLMIEEPESAAFPGRRRGGSARRLLRRPSIRTVPQSDIRRGEHVLLHLNAVRTPEKIPARITSRSKTARGGLEPMAIWGTSP